MNKLMNVVMLPTKKALNTIVKVKMEGGEYLSYCAEFYQVPLGEAFGTPKGRKTYQGGDFVGNILSYNHLYITSSEDIKEGDWFIDKSDNQVKQSKGYGVAIGVDQKIIASTDKSLSISNVNENEERYDTGLLKEKLLPQIPESFIQAYIKSYNEGSPITEVLVEYEADKSFLDKKDGIFEEIEYDFKIKLRPDNTIIIHPSKVYTELEIHKFLEWMKNIGVYLDTNGCVEYKIPYDSVTGLINIFNKWNNDDL